ncbi:MAP/microtubule affinity-regulating kinase 4-like [Perognathus longimembris pacificus]|uniref:MAP/microtubule affinity-regulating kinase 4-like n=1 Tax=Perognathus longimembris pacificus TaxID=214514 RepID=UPI002019A7C5|nr:MAP/microtubule affinity-regulating kinase 4-like [Perognathus longimembris pacificus]
MTMNPAKSEAMASQALEPASSVKEELSKHYDLLRTLGQGTFAEVKLAKHKISKKTVAIKIINKVDDANHPSSEGIILRNLNHPRIIKLYHIVESPMTTCLVLEYATQGDLLEYVIQYKRLKEEEACRIFHQLVDAVEFCHKNHVVHRDLKPENVLIDNDYNIKLSDFGLSAFFSDEKPLELYCGTMPFMAPEIIKCQPYHGPEIDIWSLGVILFYMVTGSVPFPSEDFVELEGQFLQLRKVIPTHLSPELHTLICDILKIDPLERPPIAHLKRHPWLKISPPCCMENKRKASYDRVTKAMCAMGFSLRGIRESLLHDQYDNTMATYLLLEEMAPEDAIDVIQSKPHDQGGTCKPPTIIFSVRERDIESSGHNVTSPLKPYMSDDEICSSEKSSKASGIPPSCLPYRRPISSSAWNQSGLPGADAVPVCMSGSRRYYTQLKSLSSENPLAEPSVDPVPVCMSGSRRYYTQLKSLSSENPLAEPSVDPVPVCMSGSGKQIVIRDLFPAPSHQDNLVGRSAPASITHTHANSQGLGSSIRPEQTVIVRRATTANNETKPNPSPHSRLVVVNVTRWCYPISTEVTHEVRVNKSVRVSVVKTTPTSASHTQVITRDANHSNQTFSATQSSLLQDNLSSQPQVAPTTKCNTAGINPIEDSKKKHIPLTQSCSKTATMNTVHSTKYYSSYRSSLTEDDLSGQLQVAPITNHDVEDIISIEDSMKSNTLPAQGSSEATIENSDRKHDSSMIDKDKGNTDFKMSSHRSIPRRILSWLRKLCCCSCRGTKAKCPKIGKKVTPQRSCQHPD